MKKTLLVVASLVLGSYAIAQTAQFTSQTAPTIGNELGMYLLDPMTPSLAGVNGENATWDFSEAVSAQMGGNSYVTKSQNTAHGDLFPASDAIVYEGLLTMYSQTTEQDQKSFGMVFNDPQYGEVIGVFAEGVTVYNYPFGYASDAVETTVSGSASMTLNGNALNSAMTGSLKSEIDGVGTLKLATNTHENVIRYVLTDELTMQAYGQNVILTSTQYSYYNHEISNLPIFVYTHVKYGFENAQAPISEYVFILTSENPNATVSEINFNADNTPAIGNELTMFRLNPTADTYANITGEGVVWDFSGVALDADAEDGEVVSRAVAVGETQNGELFEGADFAVDYEGLMTMYVSANDYASRAHGLVLNDPEYGEVIGVFDNDIAVYSFPFGYGSGVVSNGFTGVSSFSFAGNDIENAAMSGNFVSEVDGIGTLKLALNEYENTMRYKLVDTVRTTIGQGSLILVSTQYSYYNFEVSNLPIFVHASVDYKFEGASSSISTYTTVLSMEDPTVGIDENELALVSIYPNPVENEFNIVLPNTVDEASVSIVDALGRQVLTMTANGVVNTIDASSFNQGTYFVTITSESSSITKAIIVK